MSSIIENDNKNKNTRNVQRRTLDHVELDEKEAAIGTFLGLARPARGDHHLELLWTGGGQGGSDPLLRNADQDLEIVALNKDKE
jgi:hypothetical protein